MRAGGHDGGESGWRLEVSADGATATLHTPGPAAVTAMSSRAITVTVAADPGRVESGSVSAGAAELVWTVSLAEQILRRAQPTAATLLRALIDRGGTATAEDLRAATGLTLQHARGSLSTAAAAVLHEHHPQGRRWRHIIEARTHPDAPRGRVYDYHVGEHLVAVFDEALRHLGR